MLVKPDHLQINLATLGNTVRPMLGFSWLFSAKPGHQLVKPGHGQV